ncbi:hypothetical protein ACWEKR_04015 [Nocardia sp. NPDC004573]
MLIACGVSALAVLVVLAIPVRKPAAPPVGAAAPEPAAAAARA